MGFRELVYAAIFGAIVSAVTVLGFYNSPSPAPIVISPAEVAATATAAPVPGLNCPEGWSSQGWQLREDGHSYLSCDLRDEWNLVYVNDGAKVLVTRRGAFQQFVQLPDGTGDQVDDVVKTLQ